MRSIGFNDYLFLLCYSFLCLRGVPTIPSQKAVKLSVRVLEEQLGSRQIGQFEHKYHEKRYNAVHINSQIDF